MRVPGEQLRGEGILFDDFVKANADDLVGSEGAM
jgi:hypothetical protein